MPEKFHAALLSFLALFGLGGPGLAVYQGYGEGEYVLTAPQIAGTLEELKVERGQQVHKGDLLYTLEHFSEAAALDQAKAQEAAAEATLADLTKSKRLPEIDTLVAQRAQARAALALAKINYARDKKQLEAQAVSQAAVDTDKAALDQAQGHLNETEADIATAKLSTGREDAIKAAEQDVKASQAAVANAQWRLDQKIVTAPADAFVFDTLYRAGEYINAGQPVVSLLPAPYIRARFFVPSPELASIAAGTHVQIRPGDGVEVIPAHVTYVSPQAEYSPPELYNQDNRARLLFMLEATPDAHPERLHPGQPVDVLIENHDAGRDHGDSHDDE